MNIPLQTRSSVDTWDPSSMVCSVKSISGGGFFSLTARIAFSSFWLLSRTIPPALGSAIVMLDWGVVIFFAKYEERERKEGESSKLSGRDLGSWLGEIGRGGGTGEERGGGWGGTRLGWTRGAG